MTGIRTATRDWLSLLALTAISVSMSLSGVSQLVLVLSVLLATVWKGSIIIDRFMALRRVAGPWRYIVFGWLLIVTGLIGVSFLYVSPH
ncbi:MAG: cytochrome C oxidase subunit IV family protein [Burkholderiales bacterium]|nr:cytochrome C oxidase subunit IV family protein [Burkholderiales bacterium]